MEATIVSDRLKHYPVLLKEIISIISPQYGGTFIDCTFGQGGYTKEILKFSNTKVIAIDRDIESKKVADQFKKNAPSSPEYAAKVIIKNIKKKNKRILIGADAHFYDLMSRLFPKHFLKIIWGWPFFRNLFTRNK